MTFRKPACLAGALTLALAAPAAAQLGLIGPGGGPVGSGCSYSTEACNLFAAMTSSPDSTRRGQIDTAISCLKTAGVWTKEDWVLVLAAGNRHDALLDWKSPGKTYSEVGTTTFAADGGYSGTASAANYLLAPELLNAAPNVFAQEDAHISVYLNQYTRDNYAAWVATNSGYNGGIGHVDSSYVVFALPNTTSQTLTTGVAGATDADTVGMWTSSRTGHTTAALYKSGNTYAGAASWTDTAASTGVPATAQRILYGDGSTFFNPPASTTRVAYYSSGSGFTSTNAADEATCITAYLSAIGAS